MIDVSRSKGFTLIEIMIVVAIIGILASIAYPNYVRYIERGYITEAQTALLAGAQNLERCYSLSNSYTDCDAAFPERDSNNPFNLNDNEPSGQTFELSATGGPASCTGGTLTINHLGERGGCW